MQGVFVLQDNRFCWLTHISLDTPIHNGNGSSTENSLSSNTVLEARAAGQYLYFPCGLIRGALTNLGVPCDVSAEVASLPACKYITLALSYLKYKLNFEDEMLTLNDLMKWLMIYMTLIDKLIGLSTINC